MFAARADIPWHTEKSRPPEPRVVRRQEISDIGKWEQFRRRQPGFIGPVLAHP